MIYILIFFLIPLLIGLWAQNGVRKAYAQHSKTTNRMSLTGRDVAERILRDQGISDVTVRATPGELTDHYDPSNKTVNLSEGVYNQITVSAAAIAAHEVGHAIQHHKGYLPLRARSAFFPLAALSSQAFGPLIMVGFLLAALGAVLGSWLILLAVGLYLFAVIFQVITLPVEFDASRRALAEMQRLGLDESGSAQMLRAAALTYVAAALAAVATLLYYVIILLSSRS
jgi:Zn-dependent membrane protease YugP